MKSIKLFLITCILVSGTFWSCKDSVTYLKQDPPVITCYQISGNVTSVIANIVYPIPYEIVCGFVIGVSPNPILETPTNIIVWTDPAKFNMRFTTSNFNEFYIRAFAYEPRHADRVSYSNNVFISLK